MAKKAIAKQEPMVLANVESVESLLASIDDNLGGEKISVFNLAKISWPTSAGKFWTIPGIDGDEPVSEIEGVFIKKREPGRVYFKGEYSGGGDTPLCGSDDGILGYGDPFEEGENRKFECSECPYSKFGSGKNNAQACSEFRLLYMLIGTDRLPSLIQVPGMSIRPLVDFGLGLMNKGMSIMDMVVHMSLKESTSRSGQKYAELVIKKSRDLLPDESEKLAAYRDAIKPFLVRPSREEMAEMMAERD
jgi:hypothetical protein